MISIPFRVVDWSDVEKTLHPGTSGMAEWRTLQFPGLRIRLVTYSAGYLADHWCRKGHIVHCLSGEVVTEQETGEHYVLREGMTYVVSDNMSSHRSRVEHEVRLLIIDGDFLNSD